MDIPDGVLSQINNKIQHGLHAYTPAEQKALLSVKPGLTGYWQAYARNNVGYENHKRQDMELYYVKNQSLGLDVKILFKTIEAVARKRGAR